MEMICSQDRLAVRGRPDGAPIMHQNWDRLLFLHWPVDANVIRPLIPQELEIDTFEGQAWISVTPFEVTNLHTANLPPIPGLNSFLELNVRTYVYYRDVPGLWFFSLDASKLIPAIAARMAFALPYKKAEMSFTSSAGVYQFESNRSSESAAFSAVWRRGARLRDPDLNSLAFFLVERYCFFVPHDGKVQMTRVYHRPWILDEGIVESYSSTMLQPLGLTEPSIPPIAHFSETLNVEVWAPRYARDSR